MQRRIILFCVGLFVAVLGFIAYQYFTGATLSFFNQSKDLPPVEANLGPGAEHLYIENRDENGVLQYVLSAERSLSKGGGRYELFKPKATYYTTDGRVMAITSDEGLIQIDRTGTATNPKFLAKGGTLKGHVLLTIGPKDTFVENSTRLQPGQIQAQLDEALIFEYTERLLTSAGGVHIRGDRISFDGSDLKALMNADQRRVELLRIEHGNMITIKGVGEGALGLTGTPGGVLPPATQSAAAATMPTTAGAATAPAILASREHERTAYKLNFGSNVKAAMGERWMTAQKLQVTFQMAAGEAGRNIGTLPATAPAAGGTPGASAPPPPPLLDLPKPTLPTGAPASPDQDLVITWTGPMEVRPTGPTDTPLVGPKDTIVEAIGTDAIPVILHDTGRGARAYRVYYHTGLQQLQMDARAQMPVDLFDTAMGKVQCFGLTLQQATGHLQLIGPGHAEINQTAAVRPEATEAAVNKGTVSATWGTLLDLDLQNLADARNPGKKTQSIRHALFTGGADVQDPTSRISASTLDVLVARAADGKSGQAIEHVLATGNVIVRSAKTPGVVAHDDDVTADFLHCQELEVKTALFAGNNQLQPSAVLAIGDVQAMMHQVDKNNPQKVVVQELRTPRMLLTLAPKGADNAPRQSFTAGGVAQLRAFDGVKVQIEGMGPQMVIASAQTLVADPKAGTALLSGDPAQGRAGWVVLRQGSDAVSGQTILLEQKTQSAHIPGASEFVFVQPSNKANEEPTTVKVTAANGMDYDGRALVAHLSGDINAQIVGKPEQESKLHCDALEVKLASTAGAPSAKDDALGQGRIHLAQVTASGKVAATGATLDKDGKLLNRLYLRAPVLVYEEARKTLLIPAAGEMLVEDYRPDAAPRPAAEPADPNQAMGSSRGQTAFRWAESLTYAGDSGLIHMKKDVYMRHVPEKVVVPAKPNAAPDIKTTEVQMQCQDLQTQLLQAKGAVSNPLAFGTGGQTKVSKVTADTGAVLVLGTAQIAADVLEYDALGNKASAYGRNGNAATMVRPEGTGSADRIEWDLTKGSSGITLIGPRGQLQAP